jgi:hypothetical protein
MAGSRSKLDTEIQGLYALPPGEFTAARNALAKRLRKEGSKDGAETVAALPKPTVSAWAVNHLFTVEPERMEELLASGGRARKALGEILGGGDPGALRKAIQEARELANELRDRAADVLTEDGRRPGQPVVDRIATNLQSLAFTPAAEPVLERGWLDVDLPPPGFEVLAGLQLAAALPGRPGRPEKKPGPKPSQEKEEARQRKQQEREKEEAKARERREKEEARQRERLARLQALKEEAAGRADFLRRKAEQADKAATEARQTAEEAERLAAEARQRAEEAGRALAKAEQELAAARAPTGRQSGYR